MFSPEVGLFSGEAVKKVLYADSGQRAGIKVQAAGSRKEITEVWSSQNSRYFIQISP